MKLPKKKSLLTILLFSVLLISGCGPKTSSTNDESSSLSSETSNTEESSIPSTTSLPPADYEASLNGDGWASGYLYLHYLRDNPATYNDFFVWMWQKVPSDNEGKRYDWCGFDQAGAYAAINLQSPDFIGATKIGFLIVTKDSLNKSSGMWVSDSGGDVYLTDLAKNMRPNNTLHVFTTEGKSAEPSYTYSDEVIDNPYADPDNDTLQSIANVDSSSPSPYQIAPTSPDFLNEAGTGYQIQVSSFADSNGDGLGDLRGIINKLDYLESLNVDVLWLTPVQDCESYHGYDTINFYQVDARFGTLEDYRELIYEAHQRGMRVLMDLVINHTSKNHLWFKASTALATGVDASGNAIDYRHFYHWKYSKVPLEKPWYRYATTNYYYYGKFSSSMPELNYDYQGTRDAIIDVAKFWLGFGLDGFRIDAVKHVYMKGEVADQAGDTITPDYDHATETDYSTNLTKNLHFFREFSARLKTLYPNTFIVGENFDGWDERIAPYYQGMDSQLDFAAYYHFVNNTIYESGENSANVEATSVVPNKYQRYNTARKGRAINSGFTSNHDVERMLNHVQNTRTGSGTSITEHHTAITPANAEVALKKARLYAAALILQPGLTFIYYGDEIGLSGNVSPNTEDNAPSSALGESYHLDRWYRQPMKWTTSGNDEATTNYSFSGFKVKWDDYNANTLKGVDTQANDPNSLLSFFKALTALKSDRNQEYHQTLIRGVYQGLNNSNDRVFSYKLTYESHVIQVYINFGTASATPTNVSGAMIFNYNNASLSSLPGGSILVTYQ